MITRNSFQIQVENFIIQHQLKHTPIARLLRAILASDNLSCCWLADEFLAQIEAQENILRQIPHLHICWSRTNTGQRCLFLEAT